MTLPAVGELSDLAAENADMQTRFADFLEAVRKMPGGAPISRLPISSGAITPTSWIHTVDGEGDVADTLETINTTNLPDGSPLILLPDDPAGAPVTVSEGGSSPDIDLRYEPVGTGSILLNHESAGLFLFRNGSTWEEILRFGREAIYVVDTSPAPSYVNSWQGGLGGVSDVFFFRDSLGIVHIFGSCENANPETNGTNIFTFPAGYRPPAGANLLVMDSDTTLNVQDVSVSAAGIVTFQRLNGSSDDDTLIHFAHTFPTFLT